MSKVNGLQAVLCGVAWPSAIRLMSGVHSQPIHSPTFFILPKPLAFACAPHRHRRQIMAAPAPEEAVMVSEPHQDPASELATCSGVSARPRTRAPYHRLLFVPVLITSVWLLRVGLFTALMRVCVGLDVTASDVQLTWYTDGLNVSLLELAVFSPSETTPIAILDELTITIHSVRLANCTCSIYGLYFAFIAYDPLLSDTNVMRLVRSLGGDEAAAEGSLPLAEAPGENTSTFTRVELRRVSVHPSVRRTVQHRTVRVVLPPVTLLDESLPVRVLEAGFSIGLLNWLSRVAFRTLASTSIDTVSSTLDGGVGLLASAIGTALDAVERANARAGLPGATVVRGATSGVRRLVFGATKAARAVVRGVGGGGKAVARSELTPIGIVRGVEAGVESLRGGLSEGTANLAEGAPGYDGMLTAC